jgi:two-component system, chemotaxis family, sensor kinase CheA
VIPEQIINRFRVVSIERLDKLEAAWAALMSLPDDPAPAATLQREAHTLKGDSRVVGYTDVNLLCHKLEDLLELARQRRYRVGEDFDLAVTMAIRFMAILLRKRIGTELGGIDLPGFVHQIDGVLAETRRQLEPDEPAMARTYTRKTEVAAIRARVAQAAIDLFLERLRDDRPRLRRAWVALREVVAPAPPEPVGPHLSKHEAGARALADDLGKQVELRFDLAPVAVPPDIVEALDLAVLHLVRNALDHGVEPPRVRVDAGKQPTALVDVRLIARDGVLELTVTDDGRGIDFDEVRDRGIALGLLDAHADVGVDELGALLFRPGFSTRAVATDVSGRGVGLDAVGAAVAAAGGRIAVVPEPGKGTRWTVTIPSAPTRIAATVFRAPGTDTPLAVDAGWAVEVVPAAGAIDVLDALGVGGPGSSTNGAGVGLRFRRGSCSVVLLAAGRPVAASAENLVTAVGAPVSIAVIDGVEGLLLHPEALA